ncbi:hypothetical protein V1511DRAFT_507428 [Dipodascopsis uninucleata]
MDKPVPISTDGGSFNPATPVSTLKPLPPRAAASSPRANGTRNRSSSIADLLATPPPITLSPVSSVSSSAIASEDWTLVKLAQLIQNDKVVSITGNMAVEAAYEIMIQHNFTSLPVLMNPDDATVAEAFDYADIASLLLLIMGNLNIATRIDDFDEYLAKARSGLDVPVSFVMCLTPKDKFITLSESESILKAVEYFGRGVHRLLITSSAESDFVGVVSQRRLIKFLWENARRFPSLEPLFAQSLMDLGIGNTEKVISIIGDKPVIEALSIMHEESISSIAVTDQEGNLLGNISVVDVKHLTKSTSAHLLHSSCLQFLTVILTDRGLEAGKDTYPVFNVTPLSTLAHTVAKLVATDSHRLWITQPPNYAGASPSPASSTSSDLSSNFHPQSSAILTGLSKPSSGKLVGVISLTDILSLLARSAGKGDVDPSEARRQRRRSSSSSVRSISFETTTRRSVSIDRSYRNSIDRGSRTGR